MSAVRTLLVLSATASAVMLVRPANAQESTNWRQSHQRQESPQNAALEFRFGPYKPHVDDDFASPGPYQSVFGNGTRYDFGVEIDWQALRIPMVGTLGPGFGWSYTRMSQPARFVARTGLSAEQTFLAIMPMYLVGVFRADVLARETAIPFVPYGKLGVDYSLWWTGNDLLTQARGHTWGIHYALGAMLLLDGFDRQAAMQLDNDVGINHSYVFFEWMVANSNGLGTSTPVLNVGTNTWQLGLAFEM